MEFALKERTTLIYGPFSSTVQHMMMGLTQLGADCVLVGPEADAATRFCNQLNDSREINPKFGRAVAVKNKLQSDMDIRDAIGSSVQSFGSVDLYVDAFLESKANAFQIGFPLEHIDQAYHNNFKISVALTHAVLGFMKSRKRGRILFLLNSLHLDPVVAGLRGGLIPFAQNLGKQTQEFNTTVNALSIGMTEELLLARNPEAKSIKEALEIMKQKDASLKITEPEKIMQTVSFLLGPAGAAMNGQHLSLS